MWDQTELVSWTNTCFRISHAAMLLLDVYSISMYKLGKVSAKVSNGLKLVG